MSAMSQTAEPVGPDQAPGRSTAVLAAIVAIVVGGAAADQATKAWAQSALGNGRTIDLLPTLQFDLHYNNGFSFGTGQGAGSIIGVVVIAMSLYLANLIRREQATGRSLILSAILGGAIGNLLDRIFRADDGPLSGDVVDFIDVSWFAIFNVADILVVGGVIIFVLNELFLTSFARNEPDEPPESEEPAESQEPPESEEPAESQEPAESEVGTDGSDGTDERSIPLGR
jgi:signal peptidase II